MADQNKDKNPNENLFKIIDGIILQINRTKKLFIIMIITVMVISPIALLISFLLFTPPFESTSDQKTREENGLHRFFPIRFLPPIVSAVWLGIGIRQWVILSKWTKKYDRYKKMQEEVDKKLSGEDKDNEENQ